ncbi:MAG: nitroreductase family protein [Pyrinomonadaceae bacterium]
MIKQLTDNEREDALHGVVDEEVRNFRQADYRISPAFLNRWSPRAFSLEPIDNDILMILFEAARWAASSYNEQPWRFLIARTDEDREKFLSFLVPANQAWAQHAPVLVVVVAKRTFTHNNQPNKTYHFDAGCASGYLTLQASLKGLYAHGMAGFDADAARLALGIPIDFDPLAVFAIGRRGKQLSLPDNLRELEKPSGRRPVAESIMEGSFRQKIEAEAEADTQNETDGSQNFKAG